MIKHVCWVNIIFMKSDFFSLFQMNLYVELKTFYDSVCKEPENKKALKTSSLLKHIVTDCRWNIIYCLYNLIH